jgi:hypothetical protein
MIHRLAPLETKELLIYAADPVSPAGILTEAGEQYHIRTDASGRWKDAWISCSPKGFFNVLAWVAGMRVKGAKCFCLCGILDEREQSAFAIGLERVLDVPDGGGRLQFFANDTPGYYQNNSGQIRLQVQRLR